MTHLKVRFKTFKQTFRVDVVTEVRLSPVGYLLYDDGEAVDVTFLCSVEWTLFHTEQFWCCPKKFSIASVISNLRTTIAIVFPVTIDLIASQAIR
jgi:hypothetical protein